MLVYELWLYFLCWEIYLSLDRVRLALCSSFQVLYQASILFVLSYQPIKSNIIWIKRKVLSLLFKIRECVYLPYQDWKMVPQDMSLITESSASHFYFWRCFRSPITLHSGDVRFWMGDRVLWVLQDKMVNSFVGEDKDFKFYSEFNLEPRQRSQ